MCYHIMCDVCCISVHSTSPMDVHSDLHGMVSFFLPRLSVALDESSILCRVSTL